RKQDPSPPTPLPRIGERGVRGSRIQLRDRWNQILLKSALKVVARRQAPVAPGGAVIGILGPAIADALPLGAPLARCLLARDRARGGRARRRLEACSAGHSSLAAARSRAGLHPRWPSDGCNGPPPAFRPVC